MSVIERSIKRGGVRTFDASYTKGYKSAQASEVDSDFDILYNAWNFGGINVADGGVSTAKLEDGAVTSSKLATDSVNSSHIVNGAVAEVDLAAPVAKKLVPAYTAADQFKVITVDAAGNLIWVATPPAGLVPGQVQTVHLADAPNSVTDAKITSVSWAKVTGAPTTLPPTGPAGGDLTGTYPNPVVATGKITAEKLAVDAKPWVDTGTWLVPTSSPAQRALIVPPAYSIAPYDDGTNSFVDHYVNSPNLPGQITALPKWLYRFTYRPAPGAVEWYYSPPGATAVWGKLMTLDSAGSLTITGNLNASGNINPSGNLNITGSITAGGSASVVGTSFHKQHVGAIYGNNAIANGGNGQATMPTSWWGNPMNQNSELWLDRDGVVFVWGNWTFQPAAAGFGCAVEIQQFNGSTWVKSNIESSNRDASVTCVAMVPVWNASYRRLRLWITNATGAGQSSGTCFLCAMYIGTF